ncbi:MAG: SAM-dependent methyltransferase [Corynebacterium sp.]|nr:SAM-dependent methyltransferase [Corynebacterium sp.]
MLSPDEVHYLASNIDHIRDIRAGMDSLGDRLAVMGQLNKEFGDYARAVAELFYAWESATGKFPNPQSLILCTDSAQQATPWPVAYYRACRIAELAKTKNISVVTDVTCSVGTELLALQEVIESDASGVDVESLNLIGSDLDMGRAAMARANGVDYVLRADALAPAVLGPRIVIADPARRSGGRRIVRPEDLMPPLPDVVDTYAGQPLAIKCAPGIDYSEWQGLVSVVSLDGGVKEACLYSQEFLSCEQLQVREAVVIKDGVVHEQITSMEPDFDAPEKNGVLGRYIVEPDGAVIRAGLVGHWAARHGLWFLDPHIAFLTGDSIPAGHSGWEVKSCVPLKKLKAAVREAGFDSVEILVRGVNQDPDVLRKKLGLGKKKSKNPRPGAIILARIGNNAQAYLCGPREFVEK